MTNEETKFVGMMKTRPYNVNNDASVDVLEDAKKCEKYSKPLCFSQGRHLSKEKKSKSLSLSLSLIHEIALLSYSSTFRNVCWNMHAPCQLPNNHVSSIQIPSGTD